MERIKYFSVLVLFFLLTACGNSGGQQQTPAAAKAQPDNSGLSAFELEHGIGPVKEEIILAEVDYPLAENGAQIFEMYCSACHEKTERYIGPPLGDVLERRTPAYVMNMILNPDEMVQKHPVAKSVLAEYLAPMPNQNLTMEEARAIIEYLNSGLE